MSQAPNHSLPEYWRDGIPLSMPQLVHRHLLTLSLDVDFQSMVTIGNTARGLRRIAPVKGGSFNGERLSGTVTPGADWVINRRDGVMEIDVRLTLLTDDAAPIYLSYQGRLLAPAEVMQRLAKGALLDPAEYSLTVIARFECGSDRYAWLNDSICVGTGTQHAHGPIYEFFTLGEDTQASPTVAPLHPTDSSLNTAPSK